LIRRRRALPQNTLAFVASLALCLISQTAPAQSSCVRPAHDVTTSEWDGALARRVSLHGRDISLRDALDRLSASAHIKLSYTAEELLLSRAV
jgi:hypothetical protein